MFPPMEKKNFTLAQRTILDCLPKRSFTSSLSASSSSSTLSSKVASSSAAASSITASTSSVAAASLIALESSADTLSSMTARSSATAATSSIATVSSEEAAFSRTIASSADAASSIATASLGTEASLSIVASSSEEAAFSADVPNTTALSSSTAVFISTAISSSTAVSSSAAATAAAAIDLKSNKSDSEPHHLHRPSEPDHSINLVAPDSDNASSSAKYCPSIPPKRIINDIHLLFESIPSFTDSEKLDFVSNYQPPGDDFVFPRSGNRNSKCQASWFKDFDWLLYSESADSLYCLTCIMFPSRGGQKQNLSSKLGFRSWPSAKKKLADHKQSGSHRLSYNKFLAFKVNRKDPTKAVNTMWSKAEAERIEKNRVRLKTVIECVLFLGKQCLAFRGNREDKEHFNDPATNPGNFKALLQLLEKTGNPDIKYLLRDAPRNATYTSKTICEQIIDVLREYVTTQLVADVKKAKFFSILADETRDVSNQEQMALVLRFIDEKSKVREEFIKFLRCDKGLNGEAISKVILDAIDKLGLSMTRCRAQGYDGAGAMAGCNKGTATQIQNLYPLVLFIHCFSHRLNLSVMKIIKVEVVRDMFDNCRVISDFFNDSTKRYERFVEVIQKSMPDEETIHKLIDICRTRWIERIEGLRRFKEAYKATFTALDTISKNKYFHGTEWNADSRSTATSLCLLMKKFDFILALVVSYELMTYIHSLTISLQSSTLQIVEAYQEVSTVVETLEGLKLNVDEHHQRWYEEAKRVAATIGVVPAKKRTCYFQTNRDNTPADNECEYYRRTITVPMLNNMIEDLRTRFNPENLVFVGGFYCVPTIMNKYESVWKAKLLEFMNKYRVDMPNYDSCPAELDCWETFWKNFQGDLPDTIDETLKYTKSSMYPNIHTVLLLIGTIPVTTCTCERCMSVLRRLKTYLRSRMNQDRFNSLSVLHIHYDMKIDIDAVLDRLILKYPKRVKMHNILFDE